MKKDSATNTFTGGLVLDFNPLNNLTLMTDVLTDCLNGTLITYNGNEYVLLNDMGNGRVETAYLPEGFIPVGTAELGGIIYIVSYNPLTNLSLIGSFPSPERNITSDEIASSDSKGSVILSSGNLFDTLTYKDSNGDNITETTIKNPKYKLVLLDKEVNPGDKFQVFGNVDKYASVLSAYGNDNYDINADPRYLKLHLVSVDKQGKITFLDDSLVWYDNNYYINQSETTDSSEIDLDEYRNVVSSNYSVFTSKSKGTLAVLAELECIDSFEVSWDAKISDVTDDETYDKKAEVYLYLNWTNNCSIKNKINLNNLLILDTTDEPTEVYKNTIKYPVVYDTGNAITWTFKTPDALSSVISYLNPSYTTELEIDKDTEKLKLLSARQNDGTDNDFLIKAFDNKYASGYTVGDDEYTSQIKTYKVIPGMPFGLMDYLSQNITINYNKIGTGATDLIEWRYYTNDSNVTINWGLDCYPELNKSVESVLFDFHEIGKNDLYVSPLIDNGYFYDENLSENLSNFKFKSIVPGYSEPENNDFPDIAHAVCNINGLFPEELGGSPATVTSFSYSQQIANKSSYSGHFTETIYYNKSFKKDSCYLVRISINYDGLIRYYFRYLYTSPIFNEVYAKLEVLDFSTLRLSDYIQSSMRFTNYDSVTPVAKVTNHDVLYYRTITDEDGETTETPLNISEITRYKLEEMSFNGLQRDTLTIRGLFNLKSLYKDLSGNEFTVLTSTCTFNSSENNSSFESTNTAKEYLLNTQTIGDNKISVTNTLLWSEPNRDEGFATSYILGEIIIDTPFTSHYSGQISHQITKELIPVTTATKEVNFLATKNTFEGQGNSFPSSGNENKITIALDTSEYMNSSVTDSDITKQLWKMSSISTNLNDSSRLGTDNVKALRTRLNSSGNNINGRFLSVLGHCWYDGSERNLFTLYVIKAKYGNCVFDGNKYSNSIINDFETQGTNIRSLSLLYKWVNTTATINVAELDSLASFSSYLFNPKFTINADATMQDYSINNCTFDIDLSEVPNNVYIDTSKTLYSSEAPINSVQISTNGLINCFSNLDTTIYTILNDTNHVLYTKTTPNVSIPYTVSTVGDDFTITESSTFDLHDSTNSITYRTLTLRVEDERLIVADDKYTRESSTDDSYFCSLIRLGSEWDTSTDDESLEKQVYTPKQGYILTNIIE